LTMMLTSDIEIVIQPKGCETDGTRGSSTTVYNVYCIESLFEGPKLDYKLEEKCRPVGMQGLSWYWTRKWWREVLRKERRVVEVLTGMGVEDIR
jgi:hypothetical protein